MNKFELIKRDNIIKKMVSNSRAILTKQIDFVEGCFKMKVLIGNVTYIKPIDNIDLEIFSVFYHKMAFYPIGNEKEEYNKEFLEKLNLKIQLILDEFEKPILDKCEEIIKNSIFLN